MLNIKGDMALQCSKLVIFWYQFTGGMGNVILSKIGVQV